MSNLTAAAAFAPPAPGLVVFNGMQPLLCGLRARWADERKFENFGDYEVVMSRMVESLGAKFVRGTKRPFGVVYEIGGFQYQIMVTSRTYQYARIGVAAAS
jgi:hypothetical protein